MYIYTQFLLIHVYSLQCLGIQVDVFCKQVAYMHSLLCLLAFRCGRCVSTIFYNFLAPPVGSRRYLLGFPQSDPEPAVCETFLRWHGWWSTNRKHRNFHMTWLRKRMETASSSLWENKPYTPPFCIQEYFCADGASFGQTGSLRRQPIPTMVGGPVDHRCWNPMTKVQNNLTDESDCPSIFFCACWRIITKISWSDNVQEAFAMHLYLTVKYGKKPIGSWIVEPTRGMQIPGWPIENVPLGWFLRLQAEGRLGLQVRNSWAAGRVGKLEKCQMFWHGQYWERWDRRIAHFSCKAPMFR